MPSRAKAISTSAYCHAKREEIEAVIIAGETETERLERGRSFQVGFVTIRLTEIRTQVGFLIHASR
jgi:hypothetical protein